MQTKTSSTRFIKSHSSKMTSRVVVATLLLAIGANAVAEARETSLTCLKVRQVTGTKAVDSRTIDFLMRDGSVYRNSLRTPFNGATFAGFIHRSWSNEFCDHEIITIMDSREQCVLGNFKKLSNVTAERF